MHATRNVSALRIGLTGGIGSGKSTVARMLETHGAAIIDADKISRQVTAPAGSAIDLIAIEFGPNAITPDGAMDRNFMRDLAFSDAAAKQRLEAIVHPLVSTEVQHQTAAALLAGSACIVFDIPLLVESSRWRQQLDRVLVVDCSEATQISRVTARNGWAPDVVEKVIAGQASRALRRSAADLTIYNDGVTLEALALLVAKVSACFGL